MGSRSLYAVACACTCRWAAIGGEEQTSGLAGLSFALRGELSRLDEIRKAVESTASPVPRGGGGVGSGVASASLPDKGRPPADARRLIQEL